MLFLVALGLRCCARALSRLGKQGLLFIEVLGLLIASVSLLVALRLYSHGSVIVVHGVSYSKACGIFLDQGLNPGPLHWEHEVLATGPPGESLVRLSYSQLPLICH